MPSISYPTCFCLVWMYSPRRSTPRPLRRTPCLRQSWRRSRCCTPGPAAASSQRRTADQSQISIDVWTNQKPVLACIDQSEASIDLLGGGDPACGHEVPLEVLEAVPALLDAILLAEVLRHAADDGAGVL